MLTGVVLPILGAMLVPLLVGFVWYNPKVFGTAWMEASGMTEEKAKGANMAMVFGLTFVLSFLLVGAVMPMVIHQMGVFSTIAEEPGVQEKDVNSVAMQDVMEFMTKYGDRFRTFKHGALHGTLAGIFFVLPVLGVNALFERKGFKYILINVGYWTVTLAIMGGIICQFLNLQVMFG